MNGRGWTPAEDKVLSANHKSITALSRLLHRTPTAIYFRRSQLGLSRRQNGSHGRSNLAVVTDGISLQLGHIYTILAEIHTVLQQRLPSD